MFITFSPLSMIVLKRMYVKGRDPLPEIISFGE